MFLTYGPAGGDSNPNSKLPGQSMIIACPRGDLNRSPICWPARLIPGCLSDYLFPKTPEGAAVQARPVISIIEPRTVAGKLGCVSQSLAGPAHLPPATGQQVRSHAAELVDLAARYGITGLAFASPGRLRGHVAGDRDLFDMFEFQRAATDLLGAAVTLYSDGALRNEHVSMDLVTAMPL